MGSSYVLFSILLVDFNNPAKQKKELVKVSISNFRNKII